MSFDSVVLKQYQEKVNQAAKQFGGFSRPLSEGWLKTVRTALGMSGSQLAKRPGVSKAQISKTEKGELLGSVTIKTMRNMAEAMNCRFVYAVIPEQDIEEIIEKRAVLKAKEQVKAASTQMALEDQALNKKQLEAGVKRVACELMKKCLLTSGAMNERAPRSVYCSTQSRRWSRFK